MSSLSQMRILDAALPRARQEHDMKHFRPQQIAVPTDDRRAIKVRNVLADTLDIDRDTVSYATTLGTVTEGKPWGAEARALAIADVEHEFGVDLPDSLTEPHTSVGDVVAAVVSVLAARTA